MNEQEANGVAIDLSDAIPRDTGVLQIVIPGSNKRAGWEVTFAGPGHPKTVAQNENLSRAALDKQERIEFAQVNQRKWKTDGRQPDDVRRENVSWVMGRILSWTPVTIKQFSPDAVELPAEATPQQIARASDLLSKPYMLPYFLQMTEYLGDQASFIAASART
jgi:hypothetical protein